MWFRLLGVLAIAGLLQGCASATRGWTEQIAVSSTPSGAIATVAGNGDPIECVTPCAVTVRRNADITITMQKPGYDAEVVTLTKEIAATGAAGFAGNLLLGGAVGMVVDAASGAPLEHKPNPVIVTMRPRGAAPAGPAPRKPKPPRQAPSEQVPQT
jgi:hypothetical protein